MENQVRISLLRRTEMTKIEMDFMETMIHTMREIADSQKKIAKSQERILELCEAMVAPKPWKED